MSSNEKFEREFAAFLNEEDSRIGALYRKLPQTEPDPRLDAAVRAMAHRALNPELVATPQTDSSSRRRARWLPALGAAAGVVLAAGIAFRLGPSWHGERGETGAPANDVISVRPVEAPPAAVPPLSPPPPPARTATPQGPAPTSAPAGKLQTQAAAEMPKPAAEAPLRENSARFDDSAGDRPAGATGGALGKAEKPAAGESAPQAFPAPSPAQARKRAPEIDAVERKQIMATGAWQNLHDRDAGAAANSKPAQPQTDEKAAARAKTAESPRQDELRSTTLAAPAPAPAPKPAERAPATPPLVLEQSAPPRSAAAPASAAALKSSDAEAQGAAARDEATAPVAIDKATQKKQIRSTDPNARLYPEHWLQNIRMMLRDNNRDDALRSLAEFRRMYPDYHLPDDLRDLK